jgi:L-fuculose-phosphate aldolase
MYRHRSMTSRQVARHDHRRRATGSGVDALRSDVVEACHGLARSGVVVGSAGNVSARAGDLLVVTPTGGRLSTLMPHDLAVVDLDGEIVDAPRPPTSELPLHLAVYRNFDAGAVVHTHPPMATAVACVVDALPCIHYTLLGLGGDVRVARYATFGTADLAESVVAALEDRTAALMASHGALSHGSDLDAAVDATELLEWACGVYVRACAIGTPRVLSERDRHLAAEALASYGVAGPRPPTRQI